MINKNITGVLILLFCNLVFTTNVYTQETKLIKRVATESEGGSSITGTILTEVEPNNTPQQANQVAFADTVNGSINPVNDIDYYKIMGNAGDTLMVYASNRNSSELTADLSLRDQNGNTLQSNENFDGSSYQKRIVCILPYTGIYYVRFAYWNNWSGIQKPNINEQHKLSPAKKTNLHESASYDQGDYTILFNYFQKSKPVFLGLCNWADLNYNSTRIIIDMCPNGLDTKVTIDFGTTSSYGNSFVAATNANGIDELSFTTDKITGLQPDQLYYYKVTLENDFGTTISNDNNYQFHTPPAPEGWITQFGNINESLIGIDFSDNNNGVAVGSSNTILITTDGGSSWTNKCPSQNQFWFYGQCVDMVSTNKVVAAGSSGMVLITEDGGNNWIQKQVGNCWNRGISFIDVNNGIVVNECGEIYKTSNGGNNWNQLTSPITANFLAVTMLDINRIIALSSDGRVIRSTNGGSTWSSQQLINSNNWCGGISFSDINNGMIVLNNNNYIYKTTDGGITWLQVTPNIWGNFNSVSMMDANNALIAGSSIFRTRNGGTTWTQENTGTSNWLYGIKSFPSGEACAVGDWGTILKSQNYLSVVSPNGGEHFKEGTDQNISWSTNLTDNLKIDFSTDNGTTWLAVTGSTSASAGSYKWTVPNNIGTNNKVKVTDISNTSMYDESDNVFSITASGAITEVEPNNTPQQANEVAFADTVNGSISPVNDIDYYKIKGNSGDTLMVYASNRNSSELTADLSIRDQNGYTLQGNESFENSSYLKLVICILPSTGTYYIRFAYWGNWSGVQKPNINEQHKFSPTKKTNLHEGASYDQGDYTIIFNYFLKSKPALGSSGWTDLNYNSTRIGIGIYPNGLDTKVTIDYGKTISYGYSFVAATNANSINELYFTTEKITGLQPDQEYHYKVTLQNLLGTVVSDDMPFFTPLAPEGWAHQNSGVTSRLNAIDFIDKNNGFAVGDANTILKTKSGGNTWTNVCPSNQNQTFYGSSVDMINANKIVAAGNGLVLMSEDGGNSWTQKQVGNCSDIIVSFSDANNGFLVGDCTGICKTTDGGNNWVQLTSPVTSSLVVVKMLNANTIIAASSDWWVIRSTDGGLTWTKQQLGDWSGYGMPGGISFADANNGMLLLNNNTVMFKTTDSGISWSQLSIGYSNNVSMIDANNTLVAGQNGELKRTQVGGATWTQENTGTTNSLYGIKALPSGEAWAVGDWGTILHSVQPGPYVSAKIFLEGCFKNGQMSTILKDCNFIPLNQPFNAASFGNYEGNEEVTCIPENVVDWALLELRDDDKTSIVSRRAAFLLKNGNIVDIDGSNPVIFSGVQTDNYYLVISHRNHLKIMSANPISLTVGSTVNYDFTTNQNKAYGNNPMKDLGEGKYGMISGDANGDGMITTLDYNFWLPEARAAKTGCCNTDVNLDGLNTTLDYNLWLPNARAARKSQVP